MSTPDKATPFGALLSATTMVVAVLFVAGFSYRWAYFYNFGLNHLLFSFSGQSVIVSSLELLRRPSNAALTAAVVLGALLAVNVAIWCVTKLFQTKSASGWVVTHSVVLCLQNRFVIESIRALALVYAAFIAGQIVGYKTFLEHVADTPRNPLPAVTLAAPEGSEGLVSAILCDRAPYQPPDFLGSARRLRTIDENVIGCNSTERTWRLLYRDQNYVYVFASIAKTNSRDIARPLTLAVPRRADLLIVME